MRLVTTLALAAAVAAPAFLCTPRALAGPAPHVTSVIEGRANGEDRAVLVLIGKKVNRFKTFALRDEAGNELEAPTLVGKSKSMLVLLCPAGLAAGSYDLTMGFGKADSQTHRVHVTNGGVLPGTLTADSFDVTLRTDIDDASALEGRGASFFQNAANLDSGTLDPSRFSAYDDLTGEARVGDQAGQVAAGDHTHAPYTAGTNVALNGMEFSVPSLPWTDLANRPAGLDDGDDDTTYTAGKNVTLTGTEFAVNAVPWSDLTGVPAGFADGIDDTDSAWSVSGSDVHRPSGRVGIGTQPTTAALEVGGVDGVLFGGTAGQGAIPATGAGARLMWYPNKSAFRVGRVTNDLNYTQVWNAANTGRSSVALGENTLASADFTTALGKETEATSQYAVAMGYRSLATADAAVALGFRTTASGLYATSAGNRSTASGWYSTALGEETQATGIGSVSMGLKSNAIGRYAVAQGSMSIARGDWSVALGVETEARPYASVALGRYNTVTGSSGSWISTHPVLVVGNGSNASSRSNCFTLLKNGNLTIAGNLTENSDARLKKGITRLAGVLPKLAGIRGVSYEFKDQAKRPAGTHDVGQNGLDRVMHLGGMGLGRQSCLFQVVTRHIQKILLVDFGKQSG